VTEQEKVSSLHKKLLRLYPQGFRDGLGESMQQTFNDLYQERKIEEGRLGLIFWTFAETGIGIFREHVLLIAEGATMKTTISNPRLAPVMSFIVCVLPFMILEWATRSNAPRSDASPILWVVLWLLSTMFIAILTTVMRNVWQVGNSLMANPLSLLLRLVFLIFFAWLWFALVLDQMPCFLGGSGC
jgi:hypothetical protein